jgi:hypothetical protein
MLPGSEPGLPRWVVTIYFIINSSIHTGADGYIYGNRKIGGRRGGGFSEIHKTGVMSKRLGPAVLGLQCCMSVLPGSI